MSWTCPVCERNFRNTNQSHSCIKRKAEELYADKATNVIAVCEALMKVIADHKDATVIAVLNAILVSAKSNYIAIKPKKNCVDLEFVLDYERDEFPVYKTFQATKKLVAHFVRLESYDEVDGQLIGWLNEAYELNVK